jgi:hypothetical protein
MGPISAATEFTRKQAREMAATGNSPLDIMIKTMLFWDEDATVFAEKLMTGFANVADPDQRAELLKSIEPLLNAREHAQRCTLHAVRYVHPKLETVERRRLAVIVLTPTEPRGSQISNIDAAQERRSFE